MRRILIVTALILVLAPGVFVGGVLVLALPSLAGACDASLVVTSVPTTITATATDGRPVTLGLAQLTHAAVIVTVGEQTPDVGRDGVVIALMAALTESGLRNLANTGAYPSSASLPNDGDGGDHDSLGLFQMRPQTGWGSVPELMDPTYQARAFFGGPTGPNGGSPRGLLDIPRWHDLAPGAAAQAVEVSAYPERYARFEPVAVAILAALTTTGASASEAGLPTVTATVFPLPEGTWARTSGYGMRVNPVTGLRTLHAGVDLAAPEGTAILATAAGRVVHAGPRGGLGNAVAILHLVDGSPVVSVYGHIRDGGIHVTVGQIVTPGMHIADVGSTGNSTGPHLHLEIRPGGLDQPSIDPTGWLDHTSTSTTPAATFAPAPCATAGVAA
ncbi:M23 family metallopeptidase [Xylanimonas protaetiae]|uniref:M23 family metallopeptidase n=1 Tax=Xylanimonas protaetiae TaxID=2509457 RepID=A0A4P6EZN9_9MICO|nr:M23 family metallopeptidase [Xylanimonas protaetiae]QAY68632.1 M23 family metallopeptidase [Xylanimonas protaetiae]